MIAAWAISSGERYRRTRRRTPFTTLAVHRLVVLGGGICKALKHDRHVACIAAAGKKQGRH